MTRGAIEASLRRALELDFSIEAELARAFTLPSETYVEPHWLKAERERLFSRVWQVVAFEHELAHDGDTLATELGSLPVVVVRDGDVLRALHNVCRHRAGPVAVGCERRKSLQCRYHGWTYALDGRLLHAPEMQGAVDFDPSSIALPELALKRFGPLLLARVSEPLSEHEPELEAIAHDLSAFGFERLRHVERREYVIACNWKVYVENYLEGYHLPLVHPGLHRELDYDRYEVEPRRGHSLQHAPFRPAAGERGRKYVAEGREADARYYWLFPNVMLNCYLKQLQLNRVLPESVDRTRVVFDWFASDPFDRAALRELAEFSHEIELEDERICEAVQRGLASGSHARGRLSPRREAGVHHFHRLWHAHVSNG